MQPPRNSIGSAHYIGGDCITTLHHKNTRPSRTSFLIYLLFIVLFGVLSLRLTQLILFPPQQNTSKENSTQTLHRPIIYDRNGTILASNIPTFSLEVQPLRLRHIDTFLENMENTLPDFDKEEARRIIEKALINAEKSPNATPPHKIIYKGLTTAQKKLIMRVNNNEPVDFLNITQRTYPNGEIAAQAIGQVLYDKHGEVRRAIGLEGVINNMDARDSNITTTLDLSVQNYVHNILQKAVIKYKAKGAMAAIMDVDNGDIIALTSSPVYGTTSDAYGHIRHAQNNFTHGIYELGSVFKIFTAAMALEYGSISETQTFDTSEPLIIDGHIIDDLHGKKRPLTLAEVIIFSSNIGAAKLALTHPAEYHYDFLARLGLDNPIHADTIKTGSPLLPGKWGDLERATSSYGHTIAVSPLHVLAAGAAIVNGGKLYKPRLIDKRDTKSEPIIVIAPETSAKMRDIMRQIVIRGTAKAANIDGFTIIGKTGTADKPENGVYTDNVITSFFAAFPEDAPRYALYVVLDEPQALDETYGFDSAGWNAVPVAAEIIKTTAPLLGIAPQFDNQQNDVKDHSTPFADEPVYAYQKAQ